VLALLAGCSKNSTAPKVTPAPIPPTQFVVFASDRGRAAGSTRNFITGIDVAGTSGFTFPGGSGVVDRHPSITESGVLLVYQSSPGLGGSQDVFGYNRTSGALINDPIVNTTANETDPFLCLDGSRLAFVRDTIGGRRIRIYNTQTNRLIPLAGLDGVPGTNESAPALDEHGQRMVFVSDRNGTSDVFYYSVSNQSLTGYAPLASAGEDLEPSISGDGRYICFASSRSGGAGNYDLYLYDRAVSVMVPLTMNTASAERDPSLSYDGRRIEFASDRSGGLGGMDLWLHDRTGGTTVQVAGQNSSADDLDPVLIWR
jgi:Tol biopolymer transport system component